MSQIGILRLRVDGNTVSVPIFDTGDSGSSVFEMVKIQTGTNTGFIPVVENSTDAAHPYLKVQTQNHGIVHVHNESSLTSLHDGSDSGAVARYKLNGDVTDSWGSNDGTNNGASFVNDAISGQAASFGSASSGDYIGIDPVPDDFEQNPYTISAWVKKKATTSGRAFDHEGRQYLGYEMNASNGYEFSIYNGSSWEITTSGITNINSWYHLAGVYTGSKLRLYVDGNLQDSTSISSVGSKTPSNTAIGSHHTGARDTWDGYIDDVRIYDRALNADEIDELYLWGT